VCNKPTNVHHMGITADRHVSLVPTTFIRVSQKDTNNIQCKIYSRRKIQTIEKYNLLFVFLCDCVSYIVYDIFFVVLCDCISYIVYCILFVFLCDSISYIVYCILFVLLCDCIPYILYCLYSCVTVYRIFYIVCILV